MSLPSYGQLDKLADREGVVFFKTKSKTGETVYIQRFIPFTNVTVDVRVCQSLNLLCKAKNKML